MKNLFLPVFFALSLAGGVAQTPKPEPAKMEVAAPALTTADRIAIQACEKAKQEAQQNYQQALQQEMTVLHEWQAAHPGWHLNPDFTVAADAKPEAKDVGKDAGKPVAAPAAVKKP